MRIATWNVLAPEFCAPPKEGGRDYYARVRPFLPWSLRCPRIVALVGSLEADVVCLQEVSKVHWDRGLRPHFEALGYACVFAPRPEKRPDGVALLVRAPWRIERAEPFAFDDGSEKVALIGELRGPAGGRVGAASVHLKWTGDGHEPMAQLGRVLDHVRARGDAPAIVAGDLNVDAARHRAWAFVAEPDWRMAHPNDGRPTWFADGRGEKCDGILVRNWSHVQFCPYPDVPVEPGLPSAELPSDHLPLVADLA